MRIPLLRRLPSLACLAIVASLATVVVAQSPTSRAVATATVTTTVTASPTGTPPTCIPQYDCSSSPKGCLNNGVCEGKTCKCKPGFGGTDCGLLSCGSPLTDPSQRPTVASGTGCAACDDGFGGLNCNVCKTDAGCQSKPPSRTSFLGAENMVCNKKPEVYFNAFMSCAVRTPELEGFFPGNYSLTVDLDPVNKTMSAQLWLNKAEQFFCKMPECTLATTETDGVIKTKWDCPVLQCTCLEPTLLCGGIPGPVISLGPTINGLKGPFSLTCPHGSTDCDFFIGDLAGFFPTGLKMTECDVGECVFPSEIQSSVTSVQKSMPPGVIACLAILGALVLILIVICSVAKRNQLVLSRTPYTLNTEAASLEFRNVGYTLNKDGLEVLKGISGAAPAGVVLAVMGPSGAGKSTLVDILAGKRKDGKVTGHILLNGKQVHESEIRRAVGFVDQEDTLPPTQTVYEAVLFSAMLRLPEAMPIFRVHERVAEVIEMLGLTHCSHRRIGNVTARGISGGEKRRVSIALELITRPPILILDEPTSGLDSYSAHMVVEQLCKLAASKTTTVIMTIHQPRSDIFYMFDQTLVVSKGEALYFGPTDTAAEYFNRRGLECPKNYNIADYLLDIAMDQELLARAKGFTGADDEKTALSTGHQTHAQGNIISRRATSNSTHHGNPSEITHTSDNGQYETTVRMEESGSSGSSGSSTVSLPGVGAADAQKKQKTVYPTSFLTQLRVIMKRNWQTLIRDKSLLVLHLAVSIVLGLFIGGLYFAVPMDLAGFQNRAGSLFFMLALLGFSSISALGAFTETRTLFIKERSNGYYPPLPFVISTLLFDLIPLRIIPSLFMGCIAYFMIGLSPVVETFFKFLLILVLFNVATAMFCLVIAAAVRTTGVASLACSIVMLFMMLFGGFMINSGKIPDALTWIQYLSMFKYGFEALAVNEVATSKLIDNIQGVAFNVPGSLILQKLFGFDLGGFWKNMIVLIGFNVLFIAAFWAIVTLRLKERK
ncbi:hypothetical protein BGZ70_007708 [Mortierella alpina]|uniref:ABC transporter domain-containing protein n=1 Tax=Mortierella alpina TaxID=64518 RepID=A0A9P6J5C7_MORAP|nr:hypothetical protein BGZ70_007708 [Mortierella alpina]